MNLWNKLVIGFKMMFGGFESVTDYLLELLNEFLAKGHTPENIQKVRTYVVSVLTFLKKYREYCPSRWEKEFDKLITAVQTLCDVFEDNKITPEELAKAIEDCRAAIEEWMKD